MLTYPHVPNQLLFHLSHSCFLPEFLGWNFAVGKFNLLMLWYVRQEINCLKLYLVFTKKRKQWDLVTLLDFKRKKNNIFELIHWIFIHNLFRQSTKFSDFKEQPFLCVMNSERALWGESSASYGLGGRWGAIGGIQLGFLNDPWRFRSCAWRLGGDGWKVGLHCTLLISVI